MEDKKHDKEFNFLFEGFFFFLLIEEVTLNQELIVFLCNFSSNIGTFLIFLLLISQLITK